MFEGGRGGQRRWGPSGQRQEPEGHAPTRVAGAAVRVSHGAALHATGSRPRGTRARALQSVGLLVVLSSGDGLILGTDPAPVRAVPRGVAERAYRSRGRPLLPPAWRFAVLARVGERVSGLSNWPRLDLQIVHSLAAERL